MGFLILEGNGTWAEETFVVESLAREELLNLIRCWQCFSTLD